MGDGEEAAFTVVICTRNRAEHLHETLRALDGQAWCQFDVLVVDQSEVVDERLEDRRRADGRTVVVRDGGRGLSRARNLAWPLVRTEWVVFLDDDCIPEPDWALELDGELRAHPAAGFVSGHVGAENVPGEDYLQVTVYPVAAERWRAGRWTRPWDIGFGVCMAIRRREIERVGGWDENLGPGADQFPAADDMDFNYRFLKSGGIAYATPRVRAHHDQWRSTEQLGPLYRGYMAAWSGFAMKHLRSGDVVGGAWLWAFGVFDTAKMLGSAVRRRSGLRLRVAGCKAQGLLRGTRDGLAHQW